MGLESLAYVGAGVARLIHVLMANKVINQLMICTYTFDSPQHH